MNLEALLAKIEANKKLIETLPENTIANRKKKTDFISKEINEMKKFSSDILSEMKTRFDKIDSVKISDGLLTIKEEEKTLESLKKINNFNTPYEKMHLDYYLYQLHRYYKEDLNSVNACIKALLQTFSNVGITIVEDDFYYSPLAKEYMNAILNHIDDSLYIHDVFESVYWKSPDIIKIIERNFKSLYFKNLKKINAYYDKAREELLKEHKEEDVIDAYNKVIVRRRALESVDVYTILTRMANKDFSLADIAPENIEKMKCRLFREGTKFSIGILEKLNSSLLEYDYYMKYQYIIVDMKKRIEEKEQYKGKLDAKLKEIEGKEKELLKLNEKKLKNENPKFLSKKGTIKKDEKLAFQISEILKSIEDLYNELDEINFNDLIYKHLSTDAFISDALRVASSNYLYFVKQVKALEDGRNIKDITDEYHEFYDFMNTFSFTFLNHIRALEEKDVIEIISDHYKMYNIILEPTDLEPDNVGHIKDIVDNLIFADNIARTKLKKEDIEFYLEMKKQKLFDEMQGEKHE